MFVLRGGRRLTKARPSQGTGPREATGDGTPTGPKRQLLQTLKYRTYCRAGKHYDYGLRHMWDGYQMGGSSWVRFN